MLNGLKLGKRQMNTLSVSVQSKNIVFNKYPIEGFEMMRYAVLFCCDFSLNSYLTNILLYSMVVNDFFNQSVKILGFFAPYKEAAEVAGIHIDQMHMPYLKLFLIGRSLLKKIRIFLSYCWDDDKIADNIYDYFHGNPNIDLYRDKINIRAWDSIKKYMQSIHGMDYIILIISDSYLKSTNCMYEVLEMMRDREYKDRIFPAVINSEIYNPIVKVTYVEFWQEKFRELQEKLNRIEAQNRGELGKDLKRFQEISSNIAEFLDIVSDMNNPNITEITLRIEEKLCSEGFIPTNTISLYDQLREDFKKVRRQDGRNISYEAETLARKLWNEYHDGGGGIYLLDLARIRNDQIEIEKLYFDLIMSADVQIRDTARRWNKKWRQVNDEFYTGF